MSNLRSTALLTVLVCILAYGCTTYRVERVDKFSNNKKVVTPANSTPPDNAPPTIIITQPGIKNRETPGTVVQAEFTLEGVVLDNSRIKTVRINNESVALETNGAFAYKANLKTGKNEYQIEAIDSFGNRAAEKIILNRRDSAPQKVPALPGGIKKPNLWILAVGVSQYSNPQFNLKYADSDALILAKTFRDGEIKLFNRIYTQVLVNGGATRGNILTALSTGHLSKAGPNDVVLIFLAGHGIRNRQTGSYYFLPHNADMNNMIYAGLKWSDFDEVVKILSGNVNKVILILDTCHSGAIQIASIRSIYPEENLAEKIIGARGLYILSASKGGEFSIEDTAFHFPGESNGHGAFTYTLIKALRGAANFDKNDYVTISEVFSYVSEQVPRITNGRQHPYSKIDGTDLPIARAK